MKNTCLWAALLTGTAWGQLSQSGGPDAPQPLLCDSSQQISVTNQGTVEMVAATAGKSIHVCGFVMNSDGNTTIQLVQGQGVSCATAKTVLTPAFKMTNGSTVTFGGSVGQVLKLSGGNALCLTTTSNPDVGVLIVYAKR